MLEQFDVDIIEDDLLQLEKHILDILLFDRSTRKNIIWAVDDYAALGEGYQRKAEIRADLITGDSTLLIQPRTAKTLEEQKTRVRDRAEVFTPAWVCNQQNNLIDEAWFGRRDVFNVSFGTEWEPSREPIVFPAKGLRTWKRYVDAKRLEIACGEAPYLVSRYDATNGTMIPLDRRIGLLDRKLRVVSENTASLEEWTAWAVRAVQSVYGFEFQGDSLLPARENVFITFLEYYHQRFQVLPDRKTMETLARIISWNLWQMDAMKYVVPFTCKPIVEEDNVFSGVFTSQWPCPGCQNNDVQKHTGVYCRIMDWRAKRSVRYLELTRGGKKHDRV